jgi:hypothetical protein
MRVHPIPNVTIRKFCSWHEAGVPARRSHGGYLGSSRRRLNVSQTTQMTPSGPSGILLRPQSARQPPSSPHINASKYSPLTAAQRRSAPMVSKNTYTATFRSSRAIAMFVQRGGISACCGRSSVISNQGALLPTKAWRCGRTGGLSRMANGMPYSRRA